MARLDGVPVNHGRTADARAATTNHAFTDSAGWHMVYNDIAIRASLARFAHVPLWVQRSTRSLPVRRMFRVRLLFSHLSSFMFRQHMSALDDFLGHRLCSGHTMGVQL